MTDRTITIIGLLIALLCLLALALLGGSPSDAATSPDLLAGS